MGKFRFGDVVRQPLGSNHWRAMFIMQDPNNKHILTLITVSPDEDAYSDRSFYEGHPFHWNFGESGWVLVDEA